MSPNSESQQHSLPHPGTRDISDIREVSSPSIRVDTGGLIGDAVGLPDGVRQEIYANFVSGNYEQRYRDSKGRFIKAPAQEASAERIDAQSTPVMAIGSTAVGDVGDEMWKPGYEPPAESDSTVFSSDIEAWKGEDTSPNNAFFDREDFDPMPNLDETELPEESEEPESFHVYVDRDGQGVSNREGLKNEIASLISDGESDGERWSSLQTSLTHDLQNHVLGTNIAPLQAELSGYTEGSDEYVATQAKIMSMLDALKAEETNLSEVFEAKKQLAKDVELGKRTAVLSTDDEGKVTVEVSELSDEPLETIADYSVEDSTKPKNSIASRISQRIKNIFGKNKRINVAQEPQEPKNYPSREDIRAKKQNFNPKNTGPALSSDQISELDNHVFYDPKKVPVLDGEPSIIVEKKVSRPSDQSDDSIKFAPRSVKTPGGFKRHAADERADKARKDALNRDPVTDEPLIRTKPIFDPRKLVVEDTRLESVSEETDQSLIVTTEIPVIPKTLELATVEEPQLVEVVPPLNRDQLISGATAFGNLIGVKLRVETIDGVDVVLDDKNRQATDADMKWVRSFARRVLQESEA